MSNNYPSVKTPIGRGEVFWSDAGKQIRIFGEVTTIRGEPTIMSKVAMRIIHLIDRHNGYEPDKGCLPCAAIRACRAGYRRFDDY